MNKSLVKKERIAIGLFIGGAILIIGTFFISALPNIRNVSIPVSDVMENVEAPVDFESQLDSIDQEFQNINEAQRVESTFDGLDNRIDQDDSSFEDESLELNDVDTIPLQVSEE